MDRVRRREEIEKIRVRADEPGLGDRAREIARALGLDIDEAPGASAAEGGLLLVVTRHGLDLREAAGRRGVRADFLSIVPRRGRAGLSRRQPLGRAIGRGNPAVMDATAGLGHDAALLAMMGYGVTAVERSPIVAAMLHDALDRATADERCAAAPRGRLRVVHADARTMLGAGGEPPDVVYVDPMFPPKRKRGALARKSVRLLRRVVGDDEDAAELVAAARTKARDRVVVKRPTWAGPLAEGPAASIAGKLVRYDVYPVRKNR